MRVVQRLDLQQWQAFVDGHPRSNVFHTPAMFHVFARANNHRPETWAVVDGGSRILALLAPVHITLVSGLLQPLTTRSVVYGGVLCEESDRGRAALRLLLEAYASRGGRRSLFTELRHLHELGDLRPIVERCGYAYEDHLNYLIDLERPCEAIFQGIRAKTRKQIRKGLRDKHIEVNEIADRAELAEWYRLLHKTYRNVRVPLADRSLFEAAFDVLRPQGMALFLAVRIRGVMIACSLELCHRRTIYGWYGGSDRAYSRYTPNELLHWYVFEWGARRGYQVYDFGGAGRQSEEYGVRTFKAKFGGELVCFGRHTRVHSTQLLRLSRLGYSIYRSFL